MLWRVRKRPTNEGLKRQPSTTWMAKSYRSKVLQNKHSNKMVAFRLFAHSNGFTQVALIAAWPRAACLSTIINPQFLVCVCPCVCRRLYALISICILYFQNFIDMQINTEIAKANEIGKSNICTHTRAYIGGFIEFILYCGHKFCCDITAHTNIECTNFMFKYNQWNYFMQKYVYT